MGRSSRPEMLLVMIASDLCLFLTNCLSATPVPPAQSQPWTPPPAKLSPATVSAITELFNEGLADPRGCDYREIEVKMGLEGNTKTHGWVFAGEGQSRFAVGWNGLVYPAATIGSPADLEKDVAHLLAKDEKRWGSYTGTDPDARGHWPVSEWVSVDYDDLIPLKAAMLLRLGRADLAESVWNRWFTLSTYGKEDPYLLLAREWTESFYDRARYAHLRGDDAVSLAACRALLPVRSAVEAAATSRGFPKDSGKPYLEDLEGLPKLAADQERRAQEPPSIPVLASGRPAHGPERIAALIHDLELVDARQEMNPGQTDVSTDPIVAALIEEGDAAVDPLIQCFEEDTRLTRSEFTQGMQVRPGPVISVYEPAFAAIAGILKTSFYFSDSDNRATHDFGLPSDPRDRQPRDLSFADRKFLAEKIRAYWDRYKSVSQADRWYATLQDDAAGADAWFLAVTNIVQPANIHKTPRTMFGGGGSSWLAQKAAVILQGEPLRDRTNPSVSDLIIKRFKEVLALSASDKSLSFDPIGKLILALADWDGKTHLDDLREMAQAFHARFPHEQGSFASTLQTEAMIYRKRLASGDSRALEDYADWLMAIHPGEWPDFDLTDPFQMMWHNPNDAGIRQAAEKLFDGKDSPWIPLNRVKPSNGSSTLADLVDTPLIGLPEFRQEVLRRLDDQSIDGTTRTCDWFAHELSRLDGFPKIGLDLPQAQRDAAIAACKTMLIQYGDAFQSHPGDLYNDSIYANDSNNASIYFPKLDHPATPEDVKQGRAIFSLSGTARTCHLPDFPIAAWRPSRKEDPHPALLSDGNGTSKEITDYVTEGRVWQAEEVLVNGAWERYYGFVGRYQLEKAPAAEIRFAWQGADGNVSKEITGFIEGPADYVRDAPNFSFATHAFTQLNSPVPVKVKISNGSGLDQPVPATLMLPPGAKMTLPRGMSLSVSYSEKLPPKVASYSEPRFDYGSWRDIPLRKEVQIAASDAAGPTLIPTQEFTVLDIDLREFFDMSRPGTYRVKALFHLPDQASNPSNEITFSVADAAQ